MQKPGTDARRTPLALLPPPDAGAGRGLDILVADADAMVESYLASSLRMDSNSRRRFAVVWG
jgi:hypothetical protein